MTDDDMLSQSFGKFLTGKTDYKATIDDNQSKSVEQAPIQEAPKEESPPIEQPKEEPQTEPPQEQQPSNGGLNCPQCKNDLTGKENFCPECGLKIELKLICCGKELPLDAKFCPECGKRSD